LLLFKQRTIQHGHKAQLPGSALVGRQFGFGQIG
jgi:hypothetical protein